MEKEKQTVEGKAAKVLRYVDRLKIAKKLTDNLERKHNIKQSLSKLDSRINSIHMELETAEKDLENARATAPLDIDLILDKKMLKREKDFELEDLQEERELLFGKRLDLESDEGLIGVLSDDEE